MFSTKYTFYFNMYEKNPAVFIENAGFIICSYLQAGLHGSVHYPPLKWQASSSTQ